MTAAEIIANRAAAVAAVRAQLNYDPASPSATYQQEVAYDKALAAYVLANPTLFDPTEISVAETVSSQTFDPLLDDSFQWGDFAVDAIKPLADAAESVGQGALSVANAAKWAIPVLAIIAVIVLAEKYSGGTAISSVKKVFQK